MQLINTSTYPFGFKDGMSEEQYNAILELLYSFTYTDVEYKAIK